MSRGRTRGRELALWLLCHVDHADVDVAEGLDLFWRAPPDLDADDEFLAPVGEELHQTLADADARRWARRLSEAYARRAQSVDAVIEAVSQRWRLARMDRVDRNVLRLAAVELEGETTPRGVVVSEAVRMAARYGSERSVSFVNGLAEALARRLRDQAEDPATEGTDRGSEGDA